MWPGIVMLKVYFATEKLVINDFELRTAPIGVYSDFLRKHLPYITPFTAHQILSILFEGCKPGFVVGLAKEKV